MKTETKILIILVSIGFLAQFVANESYSYRLNKMDERITLMEGHNTITTKAYDGHAPFVATNADSFTVSNAPYYLIMSNPGYFPIDGLIHSSSYFSDNSSRGSIILSACHVTNSADNMMIWGGYQGTPVFRVKMTPEESKLIMRVIQRAKQD